MIFYKKAYAKINWILKIFPKQDNQTKHKIDTVMQLFLSVYDKIKITKSKQFSVNYYITKKAKIHYTDCSITKVIEWLKKQFPHIDTNYQINVKKMIPEGSGFGGESADAGFVLRYLLQKNQIELTKGQLLDLALSVGSDIPFFLYRYECAHVNEFGNRVVPQKPIKINAEYYPNNINISTSKVYEAIDKDNNYQSKVLDVKSLYLKLQEEVFDPKYIYNDLQEYVLKLNPELQIEFDKLNSFQKRKIFVNGAGSYFIIIK